MKKPSLLNSPKFRAILIAGFALLIRIAFIAFYDAHPLAGGDPTAFWSYAEGIVNGHGFRSSFEPWLADRPPLYSYFLASIFLAGGRDQQLVFLVQALIASISTAVFYFCALQLLDGFGSLTAGLLFAFFPSTLLFTQQILTEAIYIPIWVFFLACLLLLTNRQDSKIAIAVGIVLGFLALVRREALLPGGILVIAFLTTGSSRQWKSRFLQVALMFMAAGLVILPWLVRNYHVLGSPVLSSSSGYNFMVGNNPLANGTYSPPPADWQAQFQGLSELERDELAWDLSLQWIQDNPGDFIRLLPKKMLALWEPADNIMLDGADLIVMVLSLIGFAGIVQQREKWDVVAIVSLLPILTTTLISLIFVGGWRYRLLVYPGLILLAGYGAMQLASWFTAVQASLFPRQDGTQIP